MTVVEIGALHSRYVRTADRFKAIWTYHQFASGVFKNLLAQALPYSIDFQAIYARIKSVGSSINVAQAAAANNTLEESQAALDGAQKAMLLADDRIGPSILRRFFEKLKNQDETIVHQLIKFYLYADAVEGDRRDKLDYLFTRIGEQYVEERGEYASRTTFELRERFRALVGSMNRVDPPQEEVVQMIRAIRSMRDEVAAAATFDELTKKNLLKNARLFKHRVGDAYFHPDVLLAVVELNVTTKNRFAKLYEVEERRLVDDAQKLLEHGESIHKSFGEVNPALLDEIARFRDYKARFESSRAESNVKHDVVAKLKTSINTILAQLDRGLRVEDGEEVEVASSPIPDAFADDAEQFDQLATRFGREDPILRFLLRIAAAIDPAGRGLDVAEILNFPAVRELRLEPWEVAAFQKLILGRFREANEDTEELWTLFLRGAALRVKIDEEATILSTALGSGIEGEPDLMTRAKVSLDLAKEIDENFGDLLQEAVYYSNPGIIRQLYRSRFRLLRAFSGLWLLYDQQTAGE